MSSPPIARVVPLLRRRFVLLAVTALCTLTAPGFAAAPRSATAVVNVVASFSILGDMVREIGADRVQVTTLVGRNADPHSYEPTPEDVQALTRAQLLVSNGLGFEAWIPRLVESSGFAGTQMEASRGVQVRHLQQGEVLDAGRKESRPAHGQAGHDHEHDHDDHSVGSVDPHAWQDLSNGMIYARNIAQALAHVQPADSAYFRQRATNYIEKMKKLDAEVKQALAAVPEEKRTVITSHDAFGYFQQAYGIRFISIAGVSNEAEPSAQELAAIIDQARKQKVAGVFVERSTNPKLAQQIARETGSKVGGTLYSDALGKADEPAGNYLGMFSWNAGRLVYVLGQ